MAQFEVSKERVGETLHVKLKGSIDEDAILSNISFDDAQKIILELGQISSINSCGIREWIKWLKSAPSGAAITYRECPKVIVDQINMVSGFLPEGAVVESFYVPYFNESTGNEKMVLFRSGQEFGSSNVNPPAEVKDENGELMEMDVLEAKYFRFITK